MKVRGITHFHSDWSYDGSWPLAKISSYLKRAGYNCVFMTEHDKTFNDEKWQTYQNACNENSTKDFLIVPGIEYSDRSNIVHTMAWGNIPFLGEEIETYELLCEINKYKGIAVMAHPSRRNAWEKYNEIWTPFLKGIEVWNRKYDGVAPSKEAISIIKKYFHVPFIGLDFHRANQFFPLSISFEHNGELRKDDILTGLREEQIQANFAGISIDYFINGFFYSILKKLENGRRFLRKKVKGSK